MVELMSGLPVMFCLAIATASCAGGAYSIYRGFQALPEQHVDLPFFSSDPDHITEEGRVWRARIYWSVAYFVTALVLAGVFSLA